MQRSWSRKNLWENAPPWVKRAAGLALAWAPPALLLGKSFRHHVAFIRESERWSIDQIREYQLARLQRICTLAAERSEFYREHFRQAGFDPRDLRSPEDLRALPTIDKETIREHGRRMCTVPLDSPGVDYVSTGGSSGEPLEFYMGSNRSAIEYAYLTESWRRCGYRLGLPMAVVRGRVIRDRSGPFPYEYDPILRHHHYSNFDMTEENMRAYLAHMRSLGRCFLHAYPSAAAALADCLRRTGDPAPMFEGMILESELVPSDLRQHLRSAFGCRVFACYGHTEKLALAAACEQSDAYHVWPTYGYVELLDSVGAPVSTVGTTAEIVGTGFINEVMPFIRYRTGDTAEYLGSCCAACGRPHTVLGQIRGHRSDAMLIGKRGVRVSMTAINMHDTTFARTRRFQFFQDTPGRVVVRVVPVGDWAPDDGAAIVRSLQHKLGDRFDVAVQVVEDIPLTHRGKHSYFVQALSNAVDQSDPALASDAGAVLSRT